VTRLTRLQAINHALCGLDGDGKIHCFGHNIGAVLGQPDTRNLELAARVPGVPKARSVGVGDRFACALTQAGEVWCWGQAVWALNSASEAPASSRPKRIAGLSEIARLVVNSAYACGFDGQNRAHCFFGVDDPKRSRTAYHVGVLDGVRHALLPEMGVLGQVLAISNQGQLLLGANPGFDDLKQLTLAPVSGFESVSRLAGAYSRFLVQNTDGRVYRLHARQGKLQGATEAFSALDGAHDLLGTSFALFEGGQVRGVDMDAKLAPRIVKVSPLVSLTNGPGVCGVTAKREVRCVAPRNSAVADRVLFEHVQSIAGTYDTQCAIDASNHVVCRGKCETGQCGVTFGVHFSKTPLQVPLAK
jgi:hypothetical protein